MESDCNMDNHEMDIKVEIKEEPNGTQVKSEYKGVDDFHIKTVSLASHFVKELPSDIELDCNDTCKKMEIKEEPLWSETATKEFKQEMEPSAITDDVLNKLKETASFTDVTTEDVTDVEAPRLDIKIGYGNSNIGSCFLTATHLEEDRWKNNDPFVVKVSQLPNLKQQLKPEEHRTNSYSFELNAKCSNLIQNCKPPQTCDVINGKSHRLLSKVNTRSIGCDRKRLHTCEICGKSFTRLSWLKRHKFFHEGKRPHTCEICNKSFTRVACLNRHKVIHEDKRPYTCEICNKGFTQLSCLKRHKFFHEGTGAYNCEICEKGFAQASCLKRHKLFHEGKRPHTCEICNKSFTEVSGLKRHKFSHEGKRPHSCDICCKSFTQASNLKQHKLIHEGKKLHNCEICKKSFVRLSHLKQHKVIHEEKRAHTCGICCKSFRKALNLNKHKQIHEGKNPHT